MVKPLFVFILMAVLMGSGVLMASEPGQVIAQNESQKAACEGSGGRPGTDDEGNFVCLDSNTGQTPSISSVIKTIADVLLGIIGAVAVIMLIIGGFRYVVSAGDSSALESAKNTILYAVVGIVVAFMAYAAVRFIVTQLQ